MRSLCTAARADAVPAGTWATPAASALAGTLTLSSLSLTRLTSLWHTLTSNLSALFVSRQETSPHPVRLCLLLFRKVSESVVYPLQYTFQFLSLHFEHTDFHLLVHLWTWALVLSNQPHPLEPRPGLRPNARPCCVPTEARFSLPSRG